MKDQKYKQYLKRLPTNAPLKICHLCVRTTQNLMQSINDAADIQLLYENITKLKFASGWQGIPGFVCADCTQLFAATKQFVNMLLDADAFWKTYLATSQNHIPNDRTQVDEVEIKRETDESLELETVFLECSNVDVIDSIECGNDTGYELGESERFEDTDEMKNDDKIEPIVVKPRRREYRKRTASSRIVCEYCDKEFTSPIVARKHIAFHQKNFNCAHCGMVFKTNATIRLHMLTMHCHGAAVGADAPPFCTPCKREFITKECLRTHIKHFHMDEQQQTKCPDCNKTCGTASMLWHIRTHSEQKFQCSLCSKICATKMKLKRHASTHSDERPFMCEHCGIRTKSRVSIRRHIDGVHNMNKQKNYKAIRVLTCPLCAQPFVRLSKMKNHLNAEHSALAKTTWKRYRALCCVVCYLKFDSPEALEEHCRNFRGNHKRPLASGVLRRRFSDVAGHLLRNTQLNRQFECGVCKNTFKSQKSLDSHMQNHSDKPRPFKCEICGATYTRSNDLNLHKRRAHTGERSVACDLCNYRCYTQHELNSHAAWVHKTKHKT